MVADARPLENLPRNQHTIAFAEENCGYQRNLNSPRTRSAAGKRDC
jgi:hypothetical protein